MQESNFKRKAVSSGCSTPFDKVSIQVDLDGMWAVRKCYNLSEGNSFFNDPVYDEALPRFIQLFEKFNVHSDFFVVGRDMELDWKRNLIRKALDSGHEIGNHSYHHLLGLTLLDEDNIRTEILASQAILKACIGRWPQKFRSPGYDINGKVLRILSEFHIKIDQSLFPTPWGFLMRFIDGVLRGWKGRKKRQYGPIKNFFAPLLPYYPDFKNHIKKGRQRKIIEVPISVTPILRLPLHFGVILNLGERHFIRALRNLRRRNLPLHFLFHGIDLVDTEKNFIFQHKKKNRIFGPSIKEKLAIAERVLINILKFGDI